MVYFHLNNQNIGVNISLIRILKCSSLYLLLNTFDRTINRWELLITVEANMPHLERDV